ncbi:PhoH family protein [Fodinibius sediminis]|uniref:PhoH-like protein n=1 Tax=Fodinibius sediminis TaxID=1214077 RepID=A0A521DRM4_9BACT|nr:phosphate starvation-inducible protein PhoH [Fodinibius sediminis]
MAKKEVSTIADQPTVSDQTYQITQVEPVLVLGFRDEHLKKLEEAYPETTLTARGNNIKIAGPTQNRQELLEIFAELEAMAKQNGDLTDRDVKTVLALKKDNQQAQRPNPLRNKSVKGDFILNTYDGEAITAKTPGQKQIVRASATNDIVFTIGPAGTGKTYTSVALAVRALKERKVKKIILARPAVEAGETLGFLPGDLREKIDPYLRPLYDALEDMIEYDRLELHLAKNIIEIAPLAYMRGRTLNNAFVILDEAQNATNMQMKMFLTRIGFNSRAIITGDITQTDLPRKQQSGLISIQHILKDIEGISFVYLDENDVVRHRLVREIIEAYDRHENKNK